MQPDPQPTHFSSLSVPQEGESLSPRAFRADYVVEPETGCWLWQKTLNPAGYGTGSFTAAGLDAQYAHRAYYIVANGPIPTGHDVHHTCKVPRCVNPAHLELIGERAHDVESFLTDRAGGLTLADVREIRRLGRIQGYTSKQVAAMFDIHWRTVDDYWGSRRWAAEFEDGPCRPVCECPTCGETFVAEQRRTQVYCSNRCKVRANRKVAA